MQLTGEHRRRRAWAEIKDLLAGAAFPFIIQIVFSASVILFADYSEELALQIVALLFGELMLIGSYLLFGRQNGITAYRRTVQGEKKRELQPDDITLYYKTGEFALWKGFVIGAITVIPFVILQFINCLAHNSVCEFLLKYAFGWAVYPFIVIAGKDGNLTQWLNLIWIIVPICLHAGAYVWGCKLEKKRQSIAAEAQQMKGKRRK